MVAEDLFGDPNQNAREHARRKATKIVPTYLRIRYENEGTDPHNWVNQYRAYVRKKRAMHAAKKLGRNNESGSI